MITNGMQLPAKDKILSQRAALNLFNETLPGFSDKGGLMLFANGLCNGC